MVKEDCMNTEKRIILEREIRIVIEGLLFIFLLVVGAIFMYQAVVEVEVVKFNMPFQVQGDQFTPGDIVPIRMQFEKFIDVNAKVRRRLERLDGPGGELTTFYFNEYFSTLDPGKYNILNFNTSIPPCMPAGLYRLVYEYVYQVNLIKEVHYTVDSTKFKVGNR